MLLSEETINAGSDMIIHIKHDLKGGIVGDAWDKADRYMLGLTKTVSEVKDGFDNARASLGDMSDQVVRVYGIDAIAPLRREWDALHKVCMACGPAVY